MFIAVKNSKVIAIHGTEWQCRRKAKGLSKPAYWTWLESVTTEGVPDYSGEDYEIVETDAPLSYSFNDSGHIHQDGTFSLKWDGTKIVKDDTAKAEWELAEEWKRIRIQRNRLLAETDYLALKDNTLSTAMKEYRDKLRSVPQDNSDPYNITWPTKPS
tara:strand:+ start:107 stop:580 length:474 start_codon:yes stop_codon:yes gene_type:complete